MKRFLFSLLFSILCAALALPALADEREQGQFAIQKARTIIEKTTARSDELKVPAGELQKARAFLGNAQAALDGNLSWRGKLKPEVLPDILYWAEMAEIAASTGMARLDKISHERENLRLEKAIPETEAKIKVFEDKNEEIRRLREQVGKPQGEMKSLSGELSALKKAKTGLEKDVAQLKTERANLNGQVEALNAVAAGLRKDLAEKIRSTEELSAENRRLKDDFKALENRKGADIVQMEGQVRSLTRTAEFQKSLDRLGYLLRPSEKGPVVVIPRNDLIRATSRGSSLAPQAERQIQRLAEIVKTHPGTRLSMTVHGSGKPTRTENRKGTDAMAQLLRKAFLNAGISDSAVEASGAGTEAPLFPKGSGDENRRVEIQVITLPPAK
ncbi:MAG: hypothetical protein HPY65_14750 [Syntrophaceae bacterium]|nr:hypothetical protein [Syntrophaceae bacterium]